MLMPRPPTRAALRVFWTLLSIGGGVGIGLLFWALGAQSLWMLGAVGGVALVAAGAGLARPYAVALPYRGWNWLADRVAAALSTYVTAVCFFTVMVAVAHSRRDQDFAKFPARSAWVPRNAQEGSSNDDQHTATLRAGHRGWLRPLREWASQSNNGWVWGLWPFLYLLQLLGSEDAPSDPSSDIYTLY